jgi:hypothetical protein
MKQKKYFIKTLIALLFMWFFLCFYLENFKINFLDREYPMWKAKVEMANERNHFETLILGDSRTYAGLKPKELSDKTISLALGGATPIEMYLLFEEYLSHNPIPKNIIVAFAAGHYIECDSFSNRTVYFDLFESKKLLEVINLDQKLKTPILLGNYNLETSKLYVFLTYPLRYGNIIYKWRRNENLKRLKNIKKSNGHTYFGLANISPEKAGDFRYNNFNIADINERYLDKIIKLAKKNNINIIIEQMPLNKTTFDSLNTNFKTHYEEYLKMLSKKYDIIVNDKIWYLTNDHFGDSSHVNEKGASKVTKYIKEKYSDMFK